MKRTVAILFLLICAIFTLCACQREANMVEDMVSTVLSDNRTDDNSGMNQNNNNGNNSNNGNNGTITDTDGIIGNEDSTNDNNNNRSDSVM